jgi:hypothetical protein
MAPRPASRTKLTLLKVLLLLQACGGQSHKDVTIPLVPLMVRHRRQAAARLASALAKTPRQKIERADGGWRGSTLNGYLVHGNDSIYRKNFRVTKHTFHVLLGQLKGGGFCQDNRARNPAKQQTGRFKLGTSLYFFAQGTGWKAAGDCASLGESTVKKYVDHFIDGTFQVLRPIYMPKTPPSAEKVQAIRKEFAARRGVPNVAMATDGTHVPFRPDNEATAIDYRNYKGWTSILAVAFVTSFFTFVDADVGAAGRSGDNTVLSDSWLMKQIAADREAWLGPNGVIAADGGASDGSELLLNPYRSPTDADAKYYNFCHSSTRFFVEETFGRWKNRFRFLLKQGDYTHKELTRMIYASMILHNACTIHKDDAVEFDVGSDEEWQTFFTEFGSHRCPSCKAGGKAHCAHDAKNRNPGPWAAVKGAAHEQREQIKRMLWRRDYEGVEGAEALTFVSDYRRAMCEPCVV